MIKPDGHGPLRPDNDSPTGEDHEACAAAPSNPQNVTLSESSYDGPSGLAIRVQTFDFLLKNIF